MTGPLSSPWHCWSLLGPLRNLMMNKLGWAFFKLILQQSNFILVDLGAMILGFWLFLWSKSICQFCTWSKPLHCVHLDPLAKWIVSSKLGLSFTKSHGWTIGFGAWFNEVQNHKSWKQWTLSFNSNRIMCNPSIGLRISFKKITICASNFELEPFFFKMTGWVPSIGLGFWIYLKSLGSQTLDLGFDSKAKVMWILSLGFGL